MFSIINLIPQDTKFDFVGKRAIALLLSGFLLAVSVASLGMQKLNFGIDFAGGLLIEVVTPEPADIAAIRSDVAAVSTGDISVTSFGEDGRGVVIRIQQTEDANEDAQGAALSQVRDILGHDVEYRRVEMVGPKVGSELIRAGAMAVGLSLLGIAIYIWLRFEWQFAVGALMALIHDILLTLGLFSITRLSFDLTTVAALLTIAGYSINDTVVVFDRVRDELRRYKKNDLTFVLNVAMNKVLTRTILTSATTALAVLALWVFGGEVLRGFSVALLWGVAIGTYSTIFIALPVLVYFGVRRDDEEEEDDAEQAEAASSSKTSAP